MPKSDIPDDESDMGEDDFLADIGLGRDGEHKTISDDDGDGAPWSPIRDPEPAKTS
jgi:hypothetical protein